MRGRLEAAEHRVAELEQMRRENIAAYRSRLARGVDAMAAAAAQDNFGYLAENEKLKGELVALYGRLRYAKELLTPEALQRYEDDTGPQVVTMGDDGTDVAAWRRHNQ